MRRQPLNITGETKIGPDSGLTYHPLEFLGKRSIIFARRADDQKIDIGKIFLLNQMRSRTNKDVLPFERCNLTDHGDGHPACDSQLLASLFPAQIPFSASIDPVWYHHYAIVQTWECHHQLITDAFRNGKQPARLREHPSGQGIGLDGIKVMRRDEKTDGPGHARRHSAKNIIPSQMSMENIDFFIADDAGDLSGADQIKRVAEP